MALASTADKVTWLVVGLGNPGEEYVHTRHNAGFDCIDLLAEDAGVRYWKTQGGALVGQGKFRLPDGSDAEVILAKPQSYMNCSGGPVRTLCSTYKVDEFHLLVIHDEMDLEPGIVRAKFGGGLAGHNGLKSIAEKLGDGNWYRLRVGIGRPVSKQAGANYVLAVPRKEAGEAHRAGIELAAQMAKFLIGNGLEKTQQRFHS